MISHRRLDFPLPAEGYKDGVGGGGDGGDVDVYDHLPQQRSRSSLVSPPSASLLWSSSLIIYAYRLIFILKFKK